MAGVDEVVEDARIITQDEDRGAAGRGETNRPHDAEAQLVWLFSTLRPPRIASGV